ncbi:hypothetical protein HDV03_002208 [Kappamyces sp. JEL0829]|nr:hypothetical protein HDV03_002208 [Kappamyces sp. JEL0829]
MLRDSTLDFDASRFVISSAQLIGFPSPQTLCADIDLMGHLLRLSLIYYQEHGITYGLQHIQNNLEFSTMKTALIHHGVYLSMDPALFHGVPSTSKTMRSQLANSLFPFSFSTKLPTQLVFDQVYDLITGKMLAARTCFYTANQEKGQLLFSQALYIAKKSGMSILPHSFHGLSSPELEKIEIQLSCIAGLLKLDSMFCLSLGTDFLMDDSPYFSEFTWQDLANGRSTFFLESSVGSTNDSEASYSWLYDMKKLKFLEITIFFVKFIRQCIDWSRNGGVDKSLAFVERTDFNQKILQFMYTNADEDFKTLSPKLWGIPISMLKPCTVTMKSNQNFVALANLVLIHCGNVLSRSELYCAELNGPCYYTSEDILQGCIHSLARVCYYFQTLDSPEPVTIEAFAEHLPTKTLTSGKWIVSIYIICSKSLSALSLANLRNETVLFIEFMVRNHIISLLKVIGQIWELAELLSEQLLQELSLFGMPCNLSDYAQSP